jgi:hypothetical protein
VGSVSLTGADPLLFGPGLVRGLVRSPPGRSLSPLSPFYVRQKRHVEVLHRPIKWIKRKFRCTGNLSLAAMNHGVSEKSSLGIFPTIASFFTSRVFQPINTRNNVAKTLCKALRYPCFLLRRSPVTIKIFDLLLTLWYRNSNGFRRRDSSTSERPTRQFNRSNPHALC